MNCGASKSAMITHKIPQIIMQGLASHITCLNEELKKQHSVNIYKSNCKHNFIIVHMQYNSSKYTVVQYACRHD